MIYRRDYESIENLNGDKKQTLSGKQVILILLPVFVVLIVAAIIMFFNIFDNKSTIITELNETYTGDLIITATDIRTIKKPEDDEKILVGVRFIVENNSSSPHSIYARYLHCYVDDIETAVPLDVRQYFKDYINAENETLHATIYPGKKALGYEVVEAKKTSKQVEFIFDLPSYEKTVSFIFNIPPIEEQYKTGDG